MYLNDLNEFSSIFQRLQQYSHSRHQKTTSNILRIHSKAKIWFGNGSPLEGAMYILKPMVKFSGHPKNVRFYFSFLWVSYFLKILMVSDKMIHKAFYF